jgi:membrane dipeptidase
MDNHSDELFPVFDGHNDTLLRVRAPNEQGDVRSFFDHGAEGHLDLPRALEGGFAGGMFAIFIETEGEVREEPLSREIVKPKTLEAMARLKKLKRESHGRIKIVRNADELEDCLHKGVLAAVLHFEGAEAIDPELSDLEGYYQDGLRSLGLTWSRSNEFGHGVPFAFPHSPDTGPGLTEAGRRLVEECNHLGIMIDLSHLNEKGFWDVAQLSDAPLVATHSCVHALCPSPRNLTDNQLDAIAESGGLVGVNFAVAFLREDGERDEDTPIEALVRHIVYIADRIGIDSVALGSDFDGTTIPRELGDAAGLPKLIDALRKAGLDDDGLFKLSHENWLRVLRRTWR